MAKFDPRKSFPFFSSERIRSLFVRYVLEKQILCGFSTTFRFV